MSHSQIKTRVLNVPLFFEGICCRDVVLSSSSDSSGVLASGQRKKFKQKNKTAIDSNMNTK